MKQYHLGGIGLQKQVTLAEVKSFPTSAIPRNLHGISFKQIEAIDHGSYGDIYKAKRTIADHTQEVLIKQPKFEEMNLTQEAIIQHIAHMTLETYHCAWAIPKVHDIFVNKKGVCFTMEYVHGQLVSDWIQTIKGSQLPQLFHLFIAQVSLLLWLLETHLGLDHRDLKANNLVIRNEPCVLKLMLGGHPWILKSPFQVVILDFGFACIGDLIHLGDVLPPMDPCPKDGRDIFHLLVSILGLSSVQTNFSPSLLQQIDKWMAVGSKSYADMARRWPTENWVHLVTSERSFTIDSCKPEKILKSLLPELTGFLE